MPEPILNSDPVLREVSCKGCGLAFKTYHPTKEYHDYKCRKRNELRRARKASQTLVAQAQAAAPAGDVIETKHSPTREWLDTALAAKDSGLLPETAKWRITGILPDGVVMEQYDKYGKLRLFEQGRNTNVWILL